MKKKVLFIIMLGLGMSMTMAQSNDTKSNSDQQSNQNLVSTSDSTNRTAKNGQLVSASGANSKKARKQRPDIFPHSYLGVRGGLNLADMTYSASQYNIYNHFLQPRYQAGIFGHFRFGKSHLAIRPEITYIERGDSLNWLDVEYKMKSQYIDFRLPITYNFVFGHSHFSPYLMVVPQYNMAFGGTISYRDDWDYPYGDKVDITKGNINQFDGAVMFGIGFDYLIETGKLPILVSLEGGYNMGMHNTFAKKEIQNNPGVMSGDYSSIHNSLVSKDLWDGSRYNRGIEIALRVALPIGKSWKNRDLIEYVHDTIYITNNVSDTVKIMVTDTVDRYIPDTNNNRIITNTITKYQIDTVDGYIRKDCYSIKEMKAFITLGMDISDKRACLFNVKFDFDKADLRPESRAPLNEVAQMMKELPELEILIYGHTDSCGTEAYNDELSLNRAKTVMRYLNSRGVKNSRMEPKGFGENYPIEDNGTDEGRAQNRRVEIEIRNLGINLTNDKTDTSEPATKQQSSKQNTEAKGLIFRETKNN